ncbi:MAG TPA: hypothetical protein VHA09_03770 [Nitrososphaera sp.]|nr:hypothetical protein [Nitrososphaera sp.]
MVRSKGYYPSFQMKAVCDLGYVVAFNPDDKPRSDGVKGEGRLIFPEKLAESNRQMVAAAGQYVGYTLPFPPSMPPNNILDWIEPIQSYPRLPSSSLSSSPNSSEGTVSHDKMQQPTLQATYFNEGNHRFTTTIGSPQR